MTCLPGAVPRADGGQSSRGRSSPDLYEPKAERRENGSCSRAACLAARYAGCHLQRLDDGKQPAADFNAVDLDRLRSDISKAGHDIGMVKLDAVAGDTELSHRTNL